MRIEKFHITLSLSITNQFKYQQIFAKGIIFANLYNQDRVIINKNRVCGILLVLSNSETVVTILTISPIQSGNLYGKIRI